MIIIRDFFIVLRTLTGGINLDLSIDGTVTFDQEVINDTIIQYYKNLFTETAYWHPKLECLEFPLLEFAKADWSERPFRVVEVL